MIKDGDESLNNLIFSVFQDKIDVDKNDSDRANQVKPNEASPVKSDEASPVKSYQASPVKSIDSSKTPLRKKFESV